MLMHCKLLLVVKNFSRVRTCQIHMQLYIQMKRHSCFCFMCASCGKRSAYGRIGCVTCMLVNGGKFPYSYAFLIFCVCQCLYIKCCCYTRGEVPCFVCMHFCTTLAIYVVKIAMLLYLGVVKWRIVCRPILDETVYFY